MASQAVYHALKAPSDPPQPGGPLKIQIASAAWENKSLYMPNKGEVIADWLLTRLLKDKANPPPANPIVDIRYWALLSDVVADSDQSKPVKHWLLPLLNRVPISPVIVSLLHLSSCIEEVDLRLKLMCTVNKTLVTVWPIAVHKISSESLLECFGVFLGIWKDSSETNEALEQMGGWIISSLRVSVGNSSNKKKLSSLFVQNHLSNWVACSSCSPGPDLQESMFDVGIETLFNVDTLRHAHDDDHPLFAALRNIPDDLVHPVLPRIFLSFVQCIRKHRSALFSQSSTQTSSTVTEQVRESSLSFFDSCQALINESKPTSLTWSARVGLLHIVSEENLFSSGQLDGHNSLRQIVLSVLSVLGSDCGGDNAEQVPLAITCLSKLMQIDHDLILEDVPRILLELLRISNPFSSLFVFLELLLDYHVKTRTMNTHIENLFAALTPRSYSLDKDIRYVYQCSSSSALLHLTHLERLAKCTRTFLTSTQTVTIVRFILETLQTCWNQILAPADPESGQSNADNSTLALTFSFSARLASVVLSALPMQALPATLLAEVRHISGEIRDTFLPHALAKTIKAIRKNAHDSWTWQITAAAIIRLEYALDTQYSQKMWAKLVAASEDEHLLPELSLEIFRILLRWSSVGEKNGTPYPMDRLLDYLEDNFTSSEMSWGGASSSLTFGPQGKGECVLAILHMLIDRWLPVVDAIASGRQLQRLVRILVKNSGGEYVPSERLDATSLLLSAFSSAQFWELPNLRVAILAFADEATSTLADSEPRLTADGRAAILTTYQLLLLFPVEYISRTTRTELVRRAINADLLHGSLTDTDNWHSSVTVLRVFIQNVSLHLGSIDQPIATLSRYLKHLMHYNSSLQTPPDYVPVTLGLVDLHFTTLLKSSEEGSAEVTLDLLRSCPPSNVLGSVNEWRTLARLVDLLTKGFSLSSFPEEVQAEISALHGRLLSALLGHVADIDGMLANEELMNSWLRVLSLGRWLNLNNNGLPINGRRLCSLASSPSLLSRTQSDGWDGNCAMAFSILVEELQWLPEHDRLAQLGIILATYASFARSIGPSGQSQLDQRLSQSCNILSVTEFCHAMDLTYEGLSDTERPSSDSPRLVHLAALLLSEHPANTLKHTQKFTTSCLNIFVGRAEFTAGPLPLRLQVLRLIRRQCSDRPASLRTQDIGSIWSLLSKFLIKSKHHDQQTSTIVFQEITMVIGALVRFRRDLVALTLPHLSMALQQLLMSIRSPRPQLGAKQHTLVTDTLPRWVNATCPVGTEEGKALARLLETLITKTTIRTHSSTAEVQRAESLARPFSKHAAYIIKAYIDTMNDPLCILPSDLRKELRPGLFALCNMINDHSRDAMMVSGLDAGGKTIMKSLWTEYEKQKYVGKG